MRTVRHHFHHTIEAGSVEKVNVAQILARSEGNCLMSNVAKGVLGINLEIGVIDIRQRDGESGQTSAVRSNCFGELFLLVDALIVAGADDGLVDWLILIEDTNL